MISSFAVIEMEELPKRKTIRLKGYDYNEAGTYFLTICTENKRCILSSVVVTGVLDGPKIKLLPYGEIAERYIRQIDDYYDFLFVEYYVIMPNHIHILLRVEDGGPSRTPVPTIQNSVVSRFISTFKRFCNKECGENIWQKRSYDHIVRGQRDYDKIAKYICENPNKWSEDRFYVKEDAQNDGKNV